MKYTKKELVKLRKRLREVLRGDILNRYDNNEYWDESIIEAFCQDAHLTPEQEEELERGMPIC